MTTIILNTADYGAIRARLGVTADDLPDADLDSLGLLQIAEALIKAVVPDYAALTGDNATFLKAAAVALGASLAAGRLELGRSQSYRLAEYQESASGMDWAGLRAALLDESRRYLLLISTRSRARRTLFTVTGPTSTAADWPTEVDRWLARIQPHIVTWLQNGGQREFTWEVQP